MIKANCNSDFLANHDFNPVSTVRIDVLRDKGGQKGPLKTSFEASGTKSSHLFLAWFTHFVVCDLVSDRASIIFFFDSNIGIIVKYYELKANNVSCSRLRFYISSHRLIISKNKIKELFKPIT